MFPFYNVLIEKPRIKHLKNIDLLHELSFYNKLSIKQVSNAFRRYARTYKIEIVDSVSFSSIINQALEIYLKNYYLKLKALSIK